MPGALIGDVTILFLIIHPSSPAAMISPTVSQVPGAAKILEPVGWSSQAEVTLTSVVAVIHGPIMRLARVRAAESLIPQMTRTSVHFAVLGSRIPARLDAPAPLADLAR